MDNGSASSNKMAPWTTRDAWLCVLFIVIGQFLIFHWLQFAAHRSHAFSQWWGTAFGTGAVYLVQDALWLFAALWFSRIDAVRDFLEPAGLQKPVTLFGWCMVWAVVGVRLIDDYGGSKGWTAAARGDQTSSSDNPGPAWWYFALSEVLIAPFLEEVVTRGFLFRAFRAGYGFWLTTAVIVCFSAYFHRTSVSQSWFTFGCLALLWVILCFLREHTISLWDCLLCHGIFNLTGTRHWVPAAILMAVLLPFVLLQRRNQKA